MVKHQDYNDGFQDGYWAGSDASYSRGYEDGKRAERSRHQQSKERVLPASESSPLIATIGGSICLTLLAWFFVGILLLLLWLTGNSESLLFQLIFQVSLWGGVGFIVIMSVAGIIETILEHRRRQLDKNS